MTDRGLSAFSYEGVRSQGHAAQLLRKVSPPPDPCDRKSLMRVLSVYDLIGASYNAPANLIDGTFTSCEGDLQDVVGQYVQNGQSELPVPSTI